MEDNRTISQNFGTVETIIGLSVTNPFIVQADLV